MRRASPKQQEETEEAKGCSVNLIEVFNCNWKRFQVKDAGCGRPSLWEVYNYRASLHMAFCSDVSSGEEKKERKVASVDAYHVN